MKKWKKLLSVLLILFFVLPQTVGGVYAASGTWVKGAKGYRYKYDTGNYAKSEWVTIDGRKYYCKCDGYRAVTWQKVGGKQYYFNERGVMKTGWLTKDGKKYYFGKDGIMKTGWVKINAKWYYFAKGGVMKTGWLTLNRKKYYLAKTGVMVTGKKKIGGKVYTFDKNGVLKLGKYSVGDVFKFGHYEQDNNTSNGKEAIEWIVLDVKSDGSLFVVSKYALERQSYNASYVDITWEKSAIRSFLNGSFYSAAFSSAEQAKILTTTVVNSKNPYTGTSGGNNTKDKIFLLSYAEVRKYFDKPTISQDKYTINPSLKCKPTRYAAAHNALTYDFSTKDYYAKDLKQFTGCCWWWLRSPGPTAKRAAYVNNLGEYSYASFYIYNTDCAVRPAMVVKP